MCFVEGLFRPLLLFPSRQTETFSWGLVLTRTPPAYVAPIFVLTPALLVFRFPVQHFPRPSLRPPFEIDRASCGVFLWFCCVGVVGHRPDDSRKI